MFDPKIQSNSILSTTQECGYTMPAVQFFSEMNPLKLCNIKFLHMPDAKM